MLELPDVLVSLPVTTKSPRGVVVSVDIVVVDEDPYRPFFNAGWLSASSEVSSDLLRMEVDMGIPLLDTEELMVAPAPSKPDGSIGRRRGIDDGADLVRTMSGEGSNEIGRGRSHGEDHLQPEWI